MAYNYNEDYSDNEIFINPTYKPNIAQNPNILRLERILWKCFLEVKKLWLHRHSSS